MPRRRSRAATPTRSQNADLSTGKSTDVFTPCAKQGPRDYSALVKIEPVDDGVHIIIDATDDDVTLLGPDVKERDAVIVYPEGQGPGGRRGAAHADGPATTATRSSSGTTWQAERRRDEDHHPRRLL